MAQLRVSLGFAKLPDKELDNFTKTIKDQMTGNATYPTPPVTLANLETARADFEQKISDATTGGPPDTAAKNNQRQVLLGMLRQIAAYVQINCNNDMAVLLSSGFQAASTNRTQTPLDQPIELVIENGVSGQLVASVKPVKNTSLYEGRVKGATGDWLPSVFTGDSQHIEFNALTPGQNYTAQVRALGGSTGQSDWSDPSTHMCM
jgi:hypothetical protein